jgi:hypothetical protein
MIVSGQSFMSDQSPFQTQPAYVEKSSNKKRWITLFFVVLVLVIAGLGALYLLGSTAKHPAPAPTTPLPTEIISATPTPASTSAQLSVTPTATPSSAVDLTSLTVGVLNGSGTPGVAQKAATQLKSAGFSNVTTGNASAFTYTGITVYVKKSSNLQAVQKAISQAGFSSKVTTSVDATIPTEVQVIVGK